MKHILIPLLVFSMYSCHHYPPLETVEKVDLKKYSGLWYDYAHLPARFLEGCTDITAEYSLENPKYVTVYNRCIKSSTGKTSDIKGKAFPVRGSNNAKLKVQFFWPFRSDYWIVYLDENYRHAIVGGPSRKYMWILSRDPEIDLESLNKLKTRAEESGFPVNDLVITSHQNRKN